MTTITTLFSGGEGVSAGARAAGLDHLWGIEYDDAIARVARDNGFNVTTADVTQENPSNYERPDVLHASPPCPNFSTAKTNAEETPEDIALADAVARFIDVLRPRVFTLENVYKYRKSHSWGRIADTLNRCGYWYDLAHVNAADFGVPQTRKRMIVRALLGRMVPHLPPPEPWVGWYAAIEDLIPTLPESQFAPWQLERLPEMIGSSLVSSIDCTAREAEQPASTIVAVGDGHSVSPRAFIVSNAKTEWGNGMREAGEPCVAVTEQSNGRVRAFVVGSSSVDGGAPPIREQDAPAFTVDTKTPQHMRAFVHRMPTQAQYEEDERQRVHEQAFLVPGGNSTSFGIRMEDEPARTIGDTERVGNIPRAWLSQGRVVTMTPRALARFQSFPDGYRLPEKRTLACRVIGNAVPPLLYEKLIAQLVESVA